MDSSSPTTSVSPATPADAQLAQIEAALDEALQMGPGCPQPLADGMRYSVLGPGKRLRPRLVLLAAEACGGDPVAALPAACAVEMIHAYSLVHDDLPAMDDDDLRRGRPTCHIKFGEANAILIGDALQARAFELVAERVKPAEIAVRCCAELAYAAGPEQLVGGQADDLIGLFEGATVDDLRRIHSRKTGAMFLVSLRLGGLIAGGSEADLAALTTYGQTLGLAFQVTDDLLDVAGDEQAVGKRVGKDSDLGKMTYPGLLGPGPLGIEASQNYAEELVRQATEAAKHFGLRGEALAQLAEKVLGRTH